MQDQICSFWHPPDGEREEVLLKKQPLKIQIDGNMPSEIYTLVMSHIQKLEGVFPPWLEILVLKYDPLQRAEAAVRTNYNSRWAEIIITGETLASEEIKGVDRTRDHPCAPLAFF